MQLGTHHHLTYCTNIHPGESWVEVMRNLQQYFPAIKKTISPDAPFGIGLRLSEQASRELMEGSLLRQFKTWLKENDLYVFTMNGFPYGGFHSQRVKDAVHKPDWTTRERVEYSIRLCKILAELLPEGMEGSISTSPVSYKPWFVDNPRSLEFTYSIGCKNLLMVIDALDSIYQQTGKLIHLDMEPEPDGLIENTAEVISFFQTRLLPASHKLLRDWNVVARSHKDDVVSDDVNFIAESIVRRHFRVCYDVCHFAIEYEKPEDVFAALEAAGIRIGKIQISAALQLDLKNDRSVLANELKPFVESTYLHQVIERHEDGTLVHYPDLPDALEHIHTTKGSEWRTHFHVPLFVSRYKTLESTQREIERVIELLVENPICAHLEIETYTWDVLPEELKIDMQQSIEREILWVKYTYQQKQELYQNNNAKFTVS